MKLHEKFDFYNSPAAKYADIEVLKENEGYLKSWPGPHKNVNFWYELANGKAVGFN